jgi:UDP-N-acetylglucosamine--N-acetylmuramyl-(pentapeptide) pyrophosphoryl-undecaprenol N-acetylglucosamine transferase
VGNGEQRFNVADVVSSGGGVMVEDREFTPAWVDGQLLPLLRDPARIERMAAAAASVGVIDGAERLVALIEQARG